MSTTTIETFGQILTSEDRRSRTMGVILHTKTRTAPFLVEDMPELARAERIDFLRSIARIAVAAGADGIDLAVCRPGTEEVTDDDRLWGECVKTIETAPVAIWSLFLVGEQRTTPLYEAAPF